MAEIKTGPDPARLPWVTSEPDKARAAVRGFAGWILAAVIIVVGIGFFLLGSRREAPAGPQQTNTTVPVESSAPQVAAGSQAPKSARTQKPAATTSVQSRSTMTIEHREQQTPTSTVRAKVAPRPAKPAPSQVAAKTAPAVKPKASQVAAKTAPAAKPAPSQVAAKAAPKTPPAVAAKTTAKTTTVAATTTRKTERTMRRERIRTETASATRPRPLHPRSPAYGPILAAPDLRPAERFGGLAQIGAFTDKRQADLVWRDMVHANAGLEGARVSLIQNRDWNGQLFYQFQVATASPQDSEILCRSMRQINLRCEVVSFP